MKRKKGLSSRQMSSLNKNLRKKGMSKHKAYKTTGEAKRLSKISSKRAKLTKKRHPYKDFDGDRVINKFDCQPYNKFKQDEDEEEEINLKSTVLTDDDKIQIHKRKDKNEYYLSSRKASTANKFIEENQNIANFETPIKSSRNKNWHGASESAYISKYKVKDDIYKKKYGNKS